MSQSLQIITNIVLIACIVYLMFEVEKIDDSQDIQWHQEAAFAMPLPVHGPFDVRPTLLLPNDYVDMSAVKCPSSFDEESKTFRSENYWIFQKHNGDKNISLVLRPNRNTGIWDMDVNIIGNKMTITPDFYEWESFIYTGLNVLDRKNLTLERKRSDMRSATSQCVLVSTEDARDEVESRYKRLLEGNKL